jgi:hypothetical protein
VGGKRQSQTNLILLQPAKFFDKSIVRIFTSGSGDVWGKKFFDSVSCGNETCHGDQEMAQSDIWVNRGDVGAPHRENLLLFM